MLDEDRLLMPTHVIEARVDWGRVRGRGQIYEAEAERKLWAWGHVLWGQGQRFHKL